MTGGASCVPGKKSAVFGRDFVVDDAWRCCDGLAGHKAAAGLMSCESAIIDASLLVMLCPPPVLRSAPRITRAFMSAFKNAASVVQQLA